MQFQRDVYLERLKVRMNNEMVKIITGIRRSGKSYLMNTIFYNYLLSQGIDRTHILLGGNDWILEKYIRTHDIDD